MNKVSGYIRLPIHGTELVGWVDLGGMFLLAHIWWEGETAGGNGRPRSVYGCLTTGGGKGELGEYFSSCGPQLVGNLGSVFSCGPQLVEDQGSVFVVLVVHSWWRT